MATRGQQRLSRASFSRSLDKGIYGLTKTEAASTGPVRICTRSFAGIATPECESEWVSDSCVNPPLELQHPTAMRVFYFILNFVMFVTS